MAFVTKRGNRFQVRKGNDGSFLSSFGTRARAKDEVRKLHQKNNPKAKNRGASARRRET